MKHSSNNAIGTHSLRQTRRGFLRRLSELFTALLQLFSKSRATPLTDASPDSKAPSSTGKDESHNAHCTGCMTILNSLLETIGNQPFQQYIDSLHVTAAKITTLFSVGPPDTVCCIDEGCCKCSEVAFHCPGSGVLNVEKYASFELDKTKTYNPLTDDTYISTVATKFIRNGITILTYHDDCGAAIAAFTMMYGKDTPTRYVTHRSRTIDSPRMLNQLFLEAVMAKMQSVQQEKNNDRTREIRNISMQSMCRPNELHTAVTVYVDCSGCFMGGAEVDKKITTLKGNTELPPGFIVTAKGAEMDTLAREVQLALGIALGGHGLGAESFSPQKPLRVIIIARKTDSIPDDLQQRLKEMVKKMNESAQGKIIVETAVFSVKPTEAKSHMRVLTQDLSLPNVTDFHLLTK